MFRNALLISLFMVGLSLSLHGGGGLSLPSKDESSNNENKLIPNQSESYKKELSTYLEELKLDDTTTKHNLLTYVETAVSKDLSDASKFPLFNAFRKELESTKDEKKSREVATVFEETIKEFIVKKGSLIDNK